MSGRINARALISVGLLILASLACNMQAGSSGAPTSAVQAASVVFIGPQNNAMVAEGSTITFAVRATDNGAGIAKIDFSIDDAPIGSQVAPTVQTTFTARQPWTAKGVQGHFVSAVAFRADGSPVGNAQMTIQVAVAPVSDLGILPTTAGTAPTVVAQKPTLAVPTRVIPTATTAPIQAQPTSQAPAPTANTVPGQPPVLQIVGQYVNVRTGPGTNYPSTGTMKTGDTANIIGRNAESTWWFVENAQVRGWVIDSAILDKVTGDTSKVPFAQSPSTPLPPPATVAQTLAPTSTVGPVADLVFGDVTLNPPNPAANQTFTVTVVVRNQGTLDANSSLLSGVFQPGNERSDAAVPDIKAGQSVTVVIPVTLKANGANQTGTLTLDVNQNIPEGAAGEQNNTKTVTYSVS